MADTATNNQTSGAWPQLESGPLLVGGILVGIGAVVALAGLTVAGSHVVVATRRWVKELETPPERDCEAQVGAGQDGGGLGREHVGGSTRNAKVRLVRRGGNGGIEIPAWVVISPDGRFRRGVGQAPRPFGSGHFHRFSSRLVRPAAQPLSQVRT